MAAMLSRPQCVKLSADQQTIITSSTVTTRSSVLPKTFMIHQTFVRWASYILFKFVTFGPNHRKRLMCLMIFMNTGSCFHCLALCLSNCWKSFLAIIKFLIIQLLFAWASYQIRKIAGCACAGNAGNVFPRRRSQRKPIVGDPGMHHGTCVTHVPWCMSGSLTCGDGENVPGIPGACAPAILRIW